MTSDDIEGLALLAAGLRLDVAAGEYAWTSEDARRLCGAVDCLQIDVTRCGGFTGWLRAAAVAESHQRQVSAHCGPSLHAIVAGAVPNLRHVEWFADHARLEPMLVDGGSPVVDGALRPDPSVLGHGMSLRSEADQYAV